MRLAILASHPIQYQAPLFRFLSKKGHLSLRVFFCWDFGVTETYDEQFGLFIKWDIPLLDGYKYTFLENKSYKPGTNSFWGLYNPGAAQAILDFKPDCVLVQGYNHFTEIFLSYLLDKNKIPLIFRGESNLLSKRSPLKKMIKSIFLRNYFRRFSSFACIGTLNKEFYRFYGVNDKKLFHAPYTVNNEFFLNARASANVEAETWRNHLGVNNRLVFLFSAKLIPKKCPLELLQAFISADIGNEACLIFAGDGPLKDQLTKIVFEKNVDHSVKFIGFQNQLNMPKTYALGDVFVIPSSNEPWGLAVNEAMCMGLPVIASDQVASSRDLIYEGKNGWIFKSGQFEQLRLIMINIVNSKDDLKFMGERSLCKIKKWSINETADGVLLAADFATSNRFI